MAVSRPSRNPAKRASKNLRADAVPDCMGDASADAPSTRLTGLMKRIQAKANGFVFHLKRGVKTDSSGASGPSADSASAVAVPEQYLYPGPVATLHPRRRQDSSVSSASASSFRTWNAPVRTRPDLQSVGFRPDKHVTCIEVTLVNNLPAERGERKPSSAPLAPLRMNSANVGFRKQAATLPDHFRKASPEDSRFNEHSPSPFRKPSASDSLAAGNSAFRKQSASDSLAAGNSAFRNQSGMRTYCFGEQPESPCGTLSSRSSSGASDPDSGFEEAVKTPQPELSVVFRSIFNPWSTAKNPAPPPPPPPVKVQAKRSTIRREKAFRNRNKKAREAERNNELLERFHEIRKRLGDQDADQDAGQGGADGSAVSGGRLIQLPEASVVKNLVRQWNTATGQVKSREKIVASRLNSKRTEEPLRPPRHRQQVNRRRMPIRMPFQNHLGFFFLFFF